MAFLLQQTVYYSNQYKMKTVKIIDAPTKTNKAGETVKKNNKAKSY